MTISILDGDLLDQPVDVIVNPWNRNIIPWWLLIPQGVSGEIKRRGGSAPFRELGRRPLPLGCARHTGAGTLPFRGIIHVAAIDMLWRATAKSIGNGAVAACALGVELEYRSLAMPVLGAGSGGFAAETALEVIRSAVAPYEDRIDIRIIRFAP